MLTTCSSNGRQSHPALTAKCWPANRSSLKHTHKTHSRRATVNHSPVAFLRSSASPWQLRFRATHKMFRVLSNFDLFFPAKFKIQTRWEDIYNSLSPLPGVQWEALLHFILHSNVYAAAFDSWLSSDSQSEVWNQRGGPETDSRPVLPVISHKSQNCASSLKIAHIIRILKPTESVLWFWPLHSWTFFRCFWPQPVISIFILTIIIWSAECIFKISSFQLQFPRAKVCILLLLMQEQKYSITTREKPEHLDPVNTNNFSLLKDENSK